MQCRKCDIIIDAQQKKLTCIECSGIFHLKCIGNITESDFEYIVSSQVNWKCRMCDRKKATRGDTTPVTPVSEKTFNFKPGGSDSDSSTTLVSGTTKKTLCVTCDKGFSYNAHRALCVRCSGSYHFKCINMKKEEFSKTDNTWVCPVCVESVGMADRGVPSLATGLSAGDKAATDQGAQGRTYDNAIVGVMHEMRAFRQEMKEAHSDFRIQMEKYSEWLVDNGKKIEQVGNKIDNALKDINCLYQENANLKKVMNELSNKVTFLEQSGKDNVVEISGVPYKEKEDLINIIAKISDAVSFDFNASVIDNCFRFKTNVESRPGIIVVRFVRKLDKEAFMSKRRAKRNLNSRDIGFMDGEASAIYVNESLTQERRKLLNAARTAKKEKQYTYLWVRNGRIFMRKHQGDRVVTIDSSEDVNKLA